MKILIQLATVLTLVLAMLPAPSVFAQTGSEIAVTPSFVKNVPPTTFTVAVTLANIPSLIGYDVVINYNQAVLNAVHIGGGNVFACVTASPPCGSQAVTVINSTVQSTGTIEVSQIILSCATCPGATSVGSSPNATLFTITFAFQGFGSSPITISRIIMSGIVNGVIAALPTPTIVNGQAVTPPPASASLIKWKDRPAHHHLSISHDGNVQTIDSNVENTGSTPEFVQVSYTISSAAGSVTPVTSAVVPLAVGGSTIISTSFTVPPLPVRYFVFVNLLVSGDGSFFPPSGSTDTLSYAVVP